MNTTELKLTRQIKASPAEVYAVWIDPNIPGSPWFSPNDMRSSKIIFNASLDGLFYHCVKAQGRTWAHYGRFTELSPGQTVEHTWVSEATKGAESVVRTTFEAKDGGTLVTLHHTGVPDDEMGRQHAQGWGWCLGQLSEKFGAK